MRRDEFITKMAGELNNGDIREGLKLNKAETKKIITILEDTIVETIKNNDYVPFSFGKIGGKTRAAKTCRNPQTGETMEVPEKKGYPYAKFSSTIK